MDQPSNPYQELTDLEEKIPIEEKIKDLTNDSVMLVNIYISVIVKRYRSTKDQTKS